MQRFFVSAVLSIALAAALAACGSSVKLNDVPVEDKSITNAAAATDSGTLNRGVVPVQIGGAKAATAGPANVVKIIYFDFDSFAIRAEFQNVIDAHAKLLSADRSRKVAIEGHTDDKGGREYNLALGQKRAEAVRRALGLLGVNDAQLEAVSFGKEKPAVVGSSEDAMAQNRRAEVSYR